MDLGLAFSFPFQDDEWIKKVAIAALLLFVPFIGWLAVLGWLVEITRRVIRESEEPLPDWTEIGDLFELGIKGFVLAFVYAIPIIIVTVPVSVLGWFEDLQAPVAVLSICTSCFSFLYAIVLGVALPAGFGILADSGDLAEAVNPSKILTVFRAAPGPFLITLVGALIASFVASIGVILCIVGVAFTSAYAFTFQAHLIGHPHRQPGPT